MHVIRPFPIAKLVLEKSLLTYRMNFGQPQDVYPTMWFIEGPKEKIVVDTGTDAKTAARLGFRAEQISNPGEALSRIGLQPDDIDVLILTHMHFDHMEFAKQFSRARIVVQRSEYESAINPHPLLARGYMRETFPDSSRFVLVEGDSEIVDGVRVLLTPGHTPGCQSVAVKTDRGTVVICGLCTIHENLFPKEEVSKLFPVITPGIHTNVLEAYDSLMLIKRLADIALPLHDATYSFKEVIPW